MYSKCMGFIKLHMLNKVLLHFNRASKREQTEKEREREIGAAQRDRQIDLNSTRSERSGTTGYYYLPMLTMG